MSSHLLQIGLLAIMCSEAFNIYPFYNGNISLESHVFMKMHFLFVLIVQTKPEIRGASL